MTIRVLIIGFSIVISGCVTPSDHSASRDTLARERADARLDLTVGYLIQGHYRKARDNLAKAERHAPNYYRTLLTKANYYQHVDEIEKARNVYQQALYRHRRNGHVLNDYGAFLCRHGQYQQADHYFNQAIAQPSYPNIASSYENAGYCALKSGKQQQAIHYLQRALAHQPARYRTFLNLVELEIADNQLEQARARLVDFSQQYGEQRQILQLLVKVELLDGDLDSALSYQRRLAEQSPLERGLKKNSVVSN